MFGIVKTETENMSRDDLITLAGLDFLIFIFTLTLSGEIRESFSRRAKINFYFQTFL